MTDQRLCQTAAYTAALPTVRRLCQTKASLPDLGTKDPALREGGGFAKATFVELRLPSRMLAAFADSGPGTAAVASAAWSDHLLDLRFCLSLDVLSSCSVSSVDKLSL